MAMRSPRRRRLFKEMKNNDGASAHLPSKVLSLASPSRDLNWMGMKSGRSGALKNYKLGLNYKANERGFVGSGDYLFKIPNLYRARIRLRRLLKLTSFLLLVQ